MKLYIAFAVLCAVVHIEAYRVARNAEETTVSIDSLEGSTAEAQECCYPKPPRSRKFRRCCEIPVNEIFPKFSEDLQACKDSKNEAEKPSTTTTTAAPPVEDEEEEGADIENLVDSEVNSGESSEEETTKSPEKSGRSHGRGNCNRRHGPKGKRCLKPTMEKQGWSNNSTVNWDVIVRDTEGATSDEGKKWVEIIKSAIEVCKKEPYLQPGYVPEKKQGKHHHGKHNGKGRGYLIERAAFRCVKNNAVMNCPNFPEEDQYCVALREVHKRCGARKQPGRKPIKWCDNSRRNRKL